MNIKQENGKASKEEEKGDMKQHWYHFENQGKAQFLDSMLVECTNTCSLVGPVIWVGNL